MCRNCGVVVWCGVSKLWCSLMVVVVECSVECFGLVE